MSGSIKVSNQLIAPEHDLKGGCDVYLAPVMEGSESFVANLE